MARFSESKIESVQANPVGFSWSPEEYSALLDRIEAEAHLAEDQSRRQAHARAWELAKQQGVKPIKSIKDLQGDFWPEEESIDDFLAWLDALRGNDKPRSIPK